MSLLLSHPPDLIDRQFRLSEVSDPSGRVEVWDQPEWACAIGMDAGYGIPGRDYDALVVLDPEPDPQGRYRQVGELHGHWGPRLPKVMYGAYQFWREAFVVGERQVGHFALDSLWTDYGVRNLYRERNPTRPNHPMALNLGHPRAHDDVMMRRLREAVLERKLVLRSTVLIDQLARCMFYSPHEKTSDDKVADEGLKIKLSGGGSPDLVMAAAYAWAAVQEMPRQEVKRKPYAGNTLGAILGHNAFEELEDEDTGGGQSWNRR